MQTNRMWLEEDTQARKKSNGIWETFVNISLELLGELKKNKKLKWWKSQGISTSTHISKEFSSIVMRGS